MQKKIADFEHPTLQGVNAINPRNPGCRFACPGLGAFGLSARALSATPQQFKQA